MHWPRGAVPIPQALSNHVLTGSPHSMEVSRVHDGADATPFDLQ